MPRKVKNKAPLKERTRKHYRAILKVLREVIAEETWQTTYGDKRLAELVRDKGVLATHVQVYNVRVQNGIGDAYERKIEKFAAQSKRAK